MYAFISSKIGEIALSILNKYEEEIKNDRDILLIPKVDYKYAKYKKYYKIYDEPFQKSKRDWLIEKVKHINEYE